MKLKPEEAVELAKHNYIKLIIKDTKNQKKLDGFIQSLQLNSCNNYKIQVIDESELIESVDMEKIQESIQKDSHPVEVSKSYIDALTFENGIDGEKLKIIMEELHEEAVNA